jgi:hypothetical protein
MKPPYFSLNIRLLFSDLFRIRIRIRIQNPDPKPDPKCLFRFRIGSRSGQKLRFLRIRIRFRIRNTGFFNTYIQILPMKCFYVILALFWNFKSPIRKQLLKILKNLFYKNVLEFLCTPMFQWTPNIFSKNMAIAVLYPLYTHPPRHRVSQMLGIRCTQYPQ